MVKNFLKRCLFYRISKLYGVDPVIPDEIYAVPGRECSVYFANMAPSGFWGNVEVTTPIGRQDEKRWRFTPEKEDAGKSFPLQIEWKTPDGTTLAMCKSTVKVADPVKPEHITILLLVPMSYSYTKSTHNYRCVMRRTLNNQKPQYCHTLFCFQVLEFA